MVQNISNQFYQLQYLTDIIETKMMKQKIIHKLQNILDQTKQLRYQLVSIKETHQYFKQSLSATLNPIKQPLIHINQLHSPTHAFTHSILNSDQKQNINSINMNMQIKYQNKQQFCDDTPQKRVFDGMKGTTLDLKASILSQLNQLRQIQMKEEIARRVNEKIKFLNSQQKRYHQSFSKDKSLHSKSSKISSSKPIKSFVHPSKNILSSIHHSNVISKESSSQCVEVPLTIEKEPNCLKCPRGHRYYEGELNEQGLPNGHGRLEICCSMLPETICGNKSSMIDYFQGSFKSGYFDGYGTLSYKGGVKYVGQFVKGKRSGRGSLYHQGKVETARWENDNFVTNI